MPPVGKNFLYGGNFICKIPDFHESLLQGQVVNLLPFFNEVFFVMTKSYWNKPMLLVFSLSLLMSACSTMPEANPDNGERWFRMNRCNGCHGEKGAGGKGIGEKGPTIAALELSYREFLHKLREPNSAVMPTFEAQTLPDKDAADIYVWLKQQSR